MGLDSTIAFAVGLALLLVGAEGLVRGSSRLARAAGISPLVIGLTVVAFGTSSPELAVAIRGVLSDSPDIALGNVVGSNVCNVLLILGLSAAVTPLVVNQKLVRLEVPLMIGVSMGVVAMALDGAIGRVDGVLLAAGLTAYLLFTLRQTRREAAEIRAQYEAEFGAVPPSRRGLLLSAAIALVGLVLLLIGARMLVEASTVVARAFGVSELVIGLTLVAVGTSLPEIATSVLAALRGERDIAVGNIVGSNLFNLLGVLGLTAAIAPDGLRVAGPALRFDLPVMVAVAAACLPIFASGHCIRRWEGFFFLGSYAAYLLYLFLASTTHDALDAYRQAMLFFVLPLIGVTLAIVGWDAVRGRRQSRRGSEAARRKSDLPSGRT